MLPRWMRIIAAVSVVCSCLPGGAFGSDDADDEDTAKKTPAIPNIYLDLRTSYTRLPAGAFSLGFRAFAPLSTLSSTTSQGVAMDFPLTVDVNDHLSLYGGVTASTSRTEITSWTPMALESWNVGLQADLFLQNGGPIPTITLQSTLTRSIPQSPLGTTSNLTILEADYALDEDETRGFLAGVQVSSAVIDSNRAAVNPALIGYLGAYYQWPSNWKLTGRFGIQHFGGAQILNQTPLQPFTQPILRFDLDRMDDNDNRLFGITSEIAWTPKPVFQFTLRTPLFFVRN